MIGSLEIEKGCAYWTIDTGCVNAFGANEVREMRELFELCCSKFPNEIRVLCIKSHKISPSGKPIFCAGANLKERSDWNEEHLLQHLMFQRQTLHMLRTMPVFTYLYVDGYAIGLGVEMCLACDFVVSTPNGRFALPEVSLGIIPGAGGYTWAKHWARYPKEAMDWVNGGETIDSKYAQWLGVIDARVEYEPFESRHQNLFHWIDGMSAEEQWMLKEKRWSSCEFDVWFKEEQRIYAEKILAGGGLGKIHLKRNS